MIGFGHSSSLRMMGASSLYQSIAWTAIPGASLLIDADDNKQIAQLQGLIQALGGECANVTVTAIESELAWRVGSRYGLENMLAEYEGTGGGGMLASDVVKHLNAGGRPFAHGTGLRWDQVIYQMAVAKSTLEGLLPGHTVKSICWPNHSHDRKSMRLLKNAGYSAARNGYLAPTYPQVGTLGTTDYWSVKGYQSWARWLRYEMPSHLYFIPSMISGMSKVEMEDFLQNTAAWNVAHPESSQSPLWGYDSLFALWKAEHSWVQFNIHYELTAQEIEDLVSIFVDDGDFWVETMGTVGDYAAARHANYGAVHNDEFIWEPTTGNEAPDAADTPWNAHLAAITFSSDLGQDDAYDVQLDAVAAAGGKFTHFVVTDNLDTSGYLTTAELQAMHASGICEIGAEGKTHDSLIDREACRLVYSGTGFLGCRIADQLADRAITFYAGEATPYPLTIPEVVRWWDGPALALVNGAAVNTFTERIAYDHGVGSNSNVTYVTSFQNDRAVLSFVGSYAGDAGNQGRFIAGYGNLHSNADGLMLFVAAKWKTSARMLISKHANANGTRHWRFHTGYAQLNFHANSDSPPSSDWNPSGARTWAANAFAVLALCWHPTLLPTPVVLVNGLAGNPFSVAVNSITTDAGAARAIHLGALGTAADNGENFCGWIGDIIAVRKWDSGLCCSLGAWLAARWNTPNSWFLPE